MPAIRDLVEMSTYFRNFMADLLRAHNPQNDDQTQQDLDTYFNSAWRDLYAGVQVPAAATLWYPPQKGTTPGALITANIMSSSFWGAETPAGPGADPNPDLSGSVKAAKVINHGICSLLVPYVSAAQDGSGLMEKLATDGPLAVAKLVFSRYGDSADVEKRWLNAAPFLDFTEEQEDAQLGGFFLNFNVQLNVPVLGITVGGPNLYYHNALRWRLYDGRLAADGEVLDKFGRGSGASDAMVTFDDVLTRQLDHTPRTGDDPASLAEAIFQEANAQQVYEGDTGTVTCTQIVPGEDSLGYDPAEPCYDFIKQMKSDVHEALTYLSAPLGLTPEQQQQVEDSLVATDFPGGSLRNFRCAKFPEDAEGRCQLGAALLRRREAQRDRSLDPPQARPGRRQGVRDLALIVA